jgi:hypothetical protein
MTDWIGDAPDPHRAATMLVAILSMSNKVRDTWFLAERRHLLEEMQEAIQAARLEIEAFAEGLIFRSDDSG